MKWHKPIVLMVVIAALSLLVFQIEVKATGVERSYTVTIPQTAVSEAAQLGLNPQAAWDYGSFHWLQIGEADFDRLTASGLPFTYEADAGLVQVTRYLFDPLVDGEPRLTAEQRLGHTGDGFRLIQMEGPANNTRLDMLAATGVHILQYYPHHTYLVWGSASQAQAAARFDFVRWQGAFHPAYKMNSDLDSLAGKVSNVDIFFYNDGDIEATLNSITALGANILQHYPAQPDQTFFIANVELDAAAFEALAQLNTVLWFGYASPEPGLDDEMASQIVAGNHPGGVPVTGYFDHLAALGYDGSGVRWATIDTGVDYDHPDLGPRIVAGYSFPGACNPPGQPGSDCSGGGHGTHVAGIIGGDATAGYTDVNGFLYGLGVAPGHDIVALNSLMGSSWPPAGGWQENSKQAVLLDAIGGNNSWHTGEGAGLGYRAPERTHDIIVRDGNFDTVDVAEPFIQVFSAGNAGPGLSTLTAPKEAKNMIIVASSLNYRVGNINTISSFSSRGPAIDGRLGVTVAAPGSQISSARNDLGGSCAVSIPGTNNLYAFCSGTSMAAPHVAGAVALATEWWRGFNGGADPSPAMAKALLVNSATPMATIPNTSEGWGRINVTNMISPTVNVLYYDQTHLFTETGQQWTLNVGVSDPGQPLKVTLAWSDAPGAVGANPALVNNLNLTVANGGNTFLGNVFSGGWSTTGGSYDNLNNLENVYVQNPGGSATITIDAAAIAGDGVPYNGELTDQDFALICYNCVLLSEFDFTLTPVSETTVMPGETAVHEFILTNLGLDDAYDLSISGHDWTTTLQTGTPLTLTGGTMTTILVAVDTPLLLGSDTFTLTVVSQGDPNLVLTAVGVTHTEATYDASLSGPSEINAFAGETVVHEFVLSNLDFDDVYNLSIAGYDWTTTLQTGTPLTLTAGLTATISVAVETPLLAGSDTFTLTVTSQGEPGLVLVTTGTTHTEVGAGLVVSGDSEMWGAAGMTVTHSIVVTNTGGLTDSFSIEVMGDPAWSTWSDVAEVGPLAPGESATVTIYVIVGSGTMDTAAIRISSVWNPAVYLDVMVTTRTNLIFLPVTLNN